MPPVASPHGCFDNAPKATQFIEIRPLASAMGAEICGVDCASASDAAFAEIESALFHHKMIFFRNQHHLTHADQAAFSSRFGPFAEDAYTAGVSGCLEVQPVVKEASERTGHAFGSGWHTDSPFLPEPPAISILRAVDVPPYGGDTIWANNALAWRTLTPVMQAMLRPLHVRMSMGPVLEMAQAFAAPLDTPTGRLAKTRGRQLSPDLQRKVDGCAHPLVRKHPRTGEESLYCDGSYAVGLEELSPAEAEPLLSFLVSHITQPAFTCRLRWEAGTLALWDNRLCIHQAFNDYDGFRREMYRTTIAGEVPQ